MVEPMVQHAARPAVGAKNIALRGPSPARGSAAPPLRPPTATPDDNDWDEPSNDGG